LAWNRIREATRIDYKPLTQANLHEIFTKEELDRIDKIEN